MIHLYCLAFTNLVEFTSDVTIIVMSLTPVLGNYFCGRYYFKSCKKSSLVLFGSNHYGSEGVTLRKYSVIVGCIFWGNVSVLVVFANLGAGMFLDIFPLACQEFAAHKKNAFSGIITEGRRKNRN